MSKPAYLVVDARSSDPERMAEYRGLAQIAVDKFGGRYLVRGSPYTTLEGSWQPQRLVVVEFPSMDAARMFYDSPEYVAARTARAGVSDFDMLLVEGY
ncbi:MAG: DUF1330 domain-containing protein [Sulfuritalea sp.]|jgi:uncharacterized protein (DUF1330 family)|nr:DUF1330 domain-containing protein [Sulfuritalea sp.]